MYRLNNLKLSELTEIYRDEDLGFSFNYPKQANVYKWFDNDENNLRVFSEGNNRGYICDIRINSTDVVPSKPTTVSYNGVTWTKWEQKEKVLIPFGPSFKYHSVFWYTKVLKNEYVLTTGKHGERYCEKIISTFRFN